MPDRDVHRSRPYRYIYHGARYWRADIGARRLLWLTSEHRRGQSNILSLGYRGLAGMWRDLGPLRYLGKARLPVKHLSADGDMGLRVHRGYKVFDFADGIVTKLFDAGVAPATVAREKRCVRICNELDFAPRVLAIPDAAPWYAEELIRGPHIAAGGVFPDARYGAELMRCLCRLATFRTTRWVRLSTYSAQIEKELFLLCDRLPPGESSIVRGFVSRSVRGLRGADDLLPLVTSHGDFLAENILYTRNGIKVLDWESACERSALHDFYNFYTTEIYQERMAADEFHSVIRQRSDELLSIISRDNDELAEGAAAKLPILLRVFFLERLIMLLHRQLNARIRRVIWRSVQIFDAVLETESVQPRPAIPETTVKPPVSSPAYRAVTRKLP